MAKVYITGTDTQFGRRLASSLRERGHDVFIPAMDGSIMGKEQFWEAIKSNLKDATFIIPLLSNESLSVESFQAELGLIQGYIENRDSKFLLPIMLGELSDTKLPIGLSRWPILNERETISFDEIVDIIDGSISQREGKLLADSESKKEIAKRVETSAATFIGQSLGELERKEMTYRRVAYLWYALALLSLASAIAIAIWKAGRAVDPGLSWAAFSQFAVTIAVLIGLLAALAKMTFMLGKSFMVESLRNSDRIHAIKFGEFYLNAFSDKVEWSEVKDALKHWNVDSGSAFKDQDTSAIDPDILKKAADLLSSLKDATKSGT